MMEYKMEEYYGEAKTEFEMNKKASEGWHVIAVCNLKCYDMCGEERYAVTYERIKRK